MRTVATWLRRAWHWLTSMRTALILLFLLALAAIPGALLPQRSVSASLVDDFYKANPVMSPIYDRLQLFNVFGSTWFIAIVALLMVSLVGCILPRTAEHWRAFRATPVRAPKYLHRMPLHADGVVDKPLAEVEADLARVLRRWHTATYTPEQDRAGARSISAERGYARELANLFFHIGIVAMIVTFTAGRMVYYEGQVIVVTNSEAPSAVPVERSREFCNTSPANYDTFRAGPLFDGTGLTPFCFESHNFKASYLNTGQANGFSSDISYTADLGAERSGWQDYTLAVNHPLRIRGDRVYLQGHGFAPQVTVTWPNGESRTQMIQFRPTDVQNFLSSGVLRFDPPAGMYPDLAQRRENQIAIEGAFAPTASWTGPNGDQLRSSFPAMTDPALAVDIYRGDAGLDTGRPQNIFVLDQALIADGRLRKTDRVNLAQGEEVTLEGGVRVRFDGAAEYANYQIAHDPTQGWALAATALMLASLIGSVAIKRRRIWVRLVPEGESTRVEMAGLARTDRAGWGAEFDELAGRVFGGTSRRDDNGTDDASEEDDVADDLG
ncbi:cytochrome c biogenesis protein ResB [Corynebacterium liangguodongii]|uniref:Cytochrome C biogenesis protein ResB n=1 Tax=Corynebacterium liangguodongii TaxID=2079535 RepID=A0A2S0WBZ9_9CORY|nr:cytochrome c biogenesis protein ResB [Corynebacterium liangguodongii]AWB83299.1 cytochrome C biogenesis protein ResB [Corynebacterium liangguodongii]PWC00611.1 cytochrome c biogenesis protein ResB [Corynebacterium liangguodongii]